MKRLGLTTLVAVMIAFVMAPAVGAAGTIDAPRNVSGSPITDGVRISWNPVDGAGGYNVYRDGGYIATVSSPPFTEQISGAHSYYVTTFDTSKTVFSSRSNEVRVTSGVSEPRAVGPAAPRSLQASYSNGRTVLRWSSSSGAAGYNVYRNNDYVATVNGTSWSDTAGDHRYYVTAFDATKTKFSGRSNEVTGVDEGREAREDEARRQAEAEAERRVEAERQAEADRQAEAEREAQAERDRLAQEDRDAEQARQREQERQAQEAEDARVAQEARDAQAAEDERRAEQARQAREAEEQRLAEVRENAAREQAEQQEAQPQEADAAEPTVAVASVVDPDAPSNVRATTTSGRTTVRWSAVTGAGGYNVYRNDVYVATVSATEWTETATPAGHRYYVTAFNHSKDRFSIKSATVTGPPPQIDDGDGPIEEPPSNAGQDGEPAAPDADTGTDPDTDVDWHPVPTVPAEPAVPDQIVVVDDGGDDGDAVAVVDVAVVDTGVALAPVAADDGQTENEGPSAPPEPEPEPDPVEPVGEQEPVIVRDPEEFVIDEDDDEGDGDDLDGDDLDGDDLDGEPDVDEEPAPPRPTPPRPAEDAQPDAPVIIRDEDDETDEPDSNDDADGPDPDADGEPVDLTNIDWSNVESDGLDDYHDQQGGEPGAVPDNATGGPQNAGGTSVDTSAYNGPEIGDDTVENLNNIGDLTSTPENAAGIAENSGQLADGIILDEETAVTETVSQDTDGQVSVEITTIESAGVGIEFPANPFATAGISILPNVDFDSTTVSGDPGAVSDALSGENYPSTDNIADLPVGVTVTDIGAPGHQDLGGISDVSVSIGGNVGPVTAGIGVNSSTLDVFNAPITSVEVGEDEVTVNTGTTSIREEETVIAPEIGLEIPQIANAGVGAQGLQTFSQQTTSTTGVSYPNSESGVDQAQQHADEETPQLGEDGGEYTTTESVEVTSTQSVVVPDATASVVGVSLPSNTVDPYNSESVTTDVETTMLSTDSEIGGDTPQSQVETTTISNSPVLEDGQMQPGFTVSSSESEYVGPTPVAAPTVTLQTTDGIDLQMTPEQLQVDAQFASVLDPDNEILQDLASGVPLADAVPAPEMPSLMNPFPSFSNPNAPVIEAIDGIQDQQPEPTPAPVAVNTSTGGGDSDTDNTFDFGFEQTEEQQAATTQSLNENQESYEDAAYGHLEDEEDEEEDEDEDEDEEEDEEEEEEEEESGNESRVICTYFYQRGMLDRGDWVADLRFTQQNIGSQTVRGYHAWGIPAVRVMRSGSRLGRIIEPVLHYMAVHRAAELAYRMGRRDKPDYVGKVLRRTLEPMCWVIGGVVGEQNWRSLYVQPSNVRA